MLVRASGNKGFNHLFSVPVMGTGGHVSYYAFGLKNCEVLTLTVERGPLHLTQTTAAASRVIDNGSAGHPASN